MCFSWWEADGHGPLWVFGKKAWAERCRIEAQRKAPDDSVMPCNVLDLDGGGIVRRKMIPVNQIRPTPDDGDKFPFPPPPECTLAHWCMLKSIKSPAVVKCIVSSWMALPQPAASSDGTVPTWRDSEAHMIESYTSWFGNCPLVMFLWTYEAEVGFMTLLKNLARKLRRYVDRVDHHPDHRVKILIETTSGAAFTMWSQTRFIDQVKASCWGCLKRSGQVGNDQGNFPKCQHCKLARYCSQECQRKHWPKHKMVCQIMKELAAAEAYG